MFPIREHNLALVLSDKFPFNRPLGIATSEKGVLEYIDLIINEISENHSDEVIHRIKSNIH